MWIVLRVLVIACGVPLLAAALAAQSPAAPPSGDPAADAKLALQRAEALLSENRVPQAREAAQRALSLYQQLNDEHGMGVASLRLGETAFRMGDQAEAKARYERAMAAFEASGDPGARARSVLGLLRAVKAPLAEEEALLERAARDARAAGSKDIEGRVLHSLGDRLFTAGRYEPALERYEQAAALLDAAGQQVALGTVYNSLGRLYRVHGRLDAALAHQLKALAIHEKSNDRHFHLQSLNAVGVTYQALGDPGPARAYLERAMAMAGETGAPRIQDFIGANLASVLHDAGEYQRAAQLLEQTLARGLDVYPSRRYNSLAYAYLNLGRRDAALAMAQKAVEQCADQDEECVHALDARGWAYASLGNDAAAVIDLRAALDRLEAIRARLVPNDFLKQQFNSARERIYSHAIGLQMRQRHLGEALETAELARSRALVDLLAAANLPVDASPSTTTSTPPRASGEGLPSRLSVPAATVRDLAAAAARLRSTIVTYWVADESVSIWVVKADGSLHAAQVDVRRAKLAELVRATTPSLNVALQETRIEAWRELYDLLIRPVRLALPKPAGALVTIVPHGPLAALSFAALQNEHGRYLLEDYALHYVTAGAVLPFTAEKIKPGARTGRVMLVADPNFGPRSRLDPPLPPLPGARAEVRAISQLIPPRRVTLLEGTRASESAIRESSAGKTVLHFASHAIVQDDDPLGSYLALGRGADGSGTDGRLTAQEIYGLSVSADLVVMSACRSGSGRVTGDGIATLARAFFYAGAPSLVTSLWDLADEPANRLVPAFYRAWFAGASKAHALRAAQLDVLRQLRAGSMQIPTRLGPVSVPEHPVFWAGFVLVGEPN